MYDCGTWALSASWAVPATDVSGVYIADLIRTDTGGMSQIPFVVRNDASTADAVFPDLSISTNLSIVDVRAYWSAGRIRDAVGVPVIAMGSVHDPADAEQIIGRGDADLVAVGRSLLADARWADKARLGAEQSIRPCIRCNECVALVDENREVRCAVNPFAGRYAAVGGTPGGVGCVPAAAAAKVRAAAATIMSPTTKRRS